MNDFKTPAWSLYEAGLEYNRRIGFYEIARRNEHFYRGEQWDGVTRDLPRPVFNVVRRIVDYLVGTLTPENLSIRYTDERLPYLGSAALRESVAEGLRLLDSNAAYRWKTDRMNEVAARVLLNAATTGDGVFYCWWDPSAETGQPFAGEIRTEVVDSGCLFVSDVNRADLQSQDYVILSGRAPVADLRREAAAAGLSEKEVARIIPDEGDAAIPERAGSDKATYLLRFFRENGEVVAEKSTRDCVIRRTATGLKYYPLAYFNWYPRKGSYHGTSPVSEIIPNQKYVNAAYALAMKHMTDTAFSKVVYDRSRIPEWSNEVGEAIAAVGGGNVADAVSVLGVGQMQEGYLDLILNVVNTTKNLLGATDSALGDERANNTSAILALREASMVSLRQVAARFSRCLGEVAAIWADLLCACCPPERLLPVLESESGGVSARRLDYRLLSRELLRAAAECSDTTRFTPSATVTLLGELLAGGHITVRQYLQHLPEGCIADRDALLGELTSEGGEVKHE